MDEARVLFRAQSEDDLTRSKSFGKVDGPSGQTRDLGERFFKQGDQNFYEHGFPLPSNILPLGKYVFVFASRDEGTVYNVGVASTLSGSIPTAVSLRQLLSSKGFNPSQGIRHIQPPVTSLRAFIMQF